MPTVEQRVFATNLGRAKQAAGAGRWVPGRLNADKIDVREMHGDGRVVRLVREARYDILVPAALKERIDQLFVKDNSVYDLAPNGTVSDVRSGGRLLVVVPRDQKITQGIKGLPVPGAQARKLRQTGFTHVVIDRVPEACRDKAASPPSEGYDERGFALRFYAHKSGGRRDGQKGGECVEERRDELSVLQWLFENGLGELCRLPALAAFGVLPLLDEQRLRENAAVAAMRQITGLLLDPPHLEADFHRARLLTRLRETARAHVDEDDAAGQARAEERALGAFAETKVGSQALAELDDADLASSAFYVDEARGIAYVRFSMPGASYVVVVDRHGRTIAIRPLAADLKLLAQIEIEVRGELLELSGVPADASMFSAFGQALGAAS